MSGYLDTTILQNPSWGRRVTIYVDAQTDKIYVKEDGSLKETSFWWDTLHNTFCYDGLARKKNSDALYITENLSAEELKRSKVRSKRRPVRGVKEQSKGRGRPALSEKGKSSKRKGGKGGSLIDSIQPSKKSKKETSAQLTKRVETANKRISNTQVVDKRYGDGHWLSVAYTSVDLLYHLRNKNKNFMDKTTEFWKSWAKAEMKEWKKKEIARNNAILARELEKDVAKNNCNRKFKKKEIINYRQLVFSSLRTTCAILTIEQCNELYLKSDENEFFKEFVRILRLKPSKKYEDMIFEPHVVENC